MIKLLDCELQGAGTAEVESLTSFLMRLAYIHAVSLPHFVDFIDKYYEQVNGLENTVVKKAHQARTSWVRPNKTTIRILDALNLITGKDFSGSTFWFLENLVSTYKGDVVQGVRWCSECLKEMEISGVEPYFKLMWSFGGVEHCLIHKTPYQYVCGNCNQPQEKLKIERPINCCQSCGHKLSDGLNNIAPSDCNASWENEGQDLYELLHDLSCGKQRDISQDEIHKSMEMIILHRLASRTMDEELSDVAREQLIIASRRLSEGKKLGFKLVRRLAYMEGVPIYALMSGRMDHTSKNFDSKWNEDFPGSMRVIPSKRQNDHYELLERISTLMSDSEDPLSLNEIARRADVSVGKIASRYPVLVKSISTKRKNYLLSKRRKRELEARLAAMRFFTHEDYAHHNKSRKKAYKVLREETGLPKDLLRRVIQQEYITNFDAR